MFTLNALINELQIESTVGFIQQGNAVGGQPRPPNHIMARPQIPGAPMQWMQPQVHFIINNCSRVRQRDTYFLYSDHNHINMKSCRTVRRCIVHQLSTNPISIHICSVVTFHFDVTVHRLPSAISCRVINET